MSKSASSKLLFLISVFCESSEDWIDVFSSPLPRISGYPKRDKTIKEAISNLLSRGNLDYKKDGETILIRPTHQGFAQLAKTYPLYKNFLAKWDKRYRLIMYDIPEQNRNDRDSIRRVVKLFKLGNWQNSVWVTPYPVEDLLAKLKEFKLDNLVEFSEIEFYKGGGFEFAKRIWELEKINQLYKKLYFYLSEYLKKPRVKRKTVEVFRKGFLDYQNILSIDPGLPDKLLPRDWYGIKVRTLLKRLQKLL